jgi:hypothetical protein
MVTPKLPEPKVPEPKAPEFKAPAPKAPEVKTPPSDVPPLVLPDEPKASPKTSPLILPELTEPAPGKVEPKGSPLVLPPIPSAVPTPAPAPDADPKRGGPDSIPPLVLPPDLPTGPSGVIPPTTARSSPLSALPRVQVFPAAGAAAGALRKVGFFNHTDRDVRLVIEGRPVTLPAKNYLHAQLPPVFRWSEAGSPARTTTVPADAAGVDVLFRAGE